MRREGERFVLDRTQEIEAVVAGVPDDHIGAPIEDDLHGAMWTKVRVSDEVDRYVRKQQPEFVLTSKNRHEAREALEATVFLGGIKGLWAGIRGRKRTARAILEELTEVEDEVRNRRHDCFQGRVRRYGPVDRC